MATLLVQPAISAEPSQTNGKAAASKQQDEFTLKVLCTKQPYESIEDLRKDLQTLDLALPNIPPDEAAYLAKEENSAGALDASDKASAEDQLIAARRFSALQSRRLYYAWQARNALAAALISEQAIFDPDHAPAVDLSGKPTGGVGPPMWAHSIGKEDADQIYRMIATITSVHVTSNAVREFLLNEQYRATAGQKSLLTTKQWSDSSTAAYGSLYHLSAALGCAYMQYGMKHR